MISSRDICITINNDKSQTLYECSILNDLILTYLQAILSGKYINSTKYK